MKKYCKILNNTTGLVQLGVGCTEDYYESIGMTKENVAQSEVDGLWYLSNKCPHYTDEEKFEIAKTDKYTEALEKAEQYIQEQACYQYDTNNSIEATDGNIGKFTAYALALQSGLAESVTWTTKEDNVITLELEDVITILTGLGNVQANVWNVQFIAYKNAIESAETIEEIEGIIINYGG